MMPVQQSRRPFDLAGGLQTGTGLAELRLNVDHSKLAVFYLAMSGHGPQESDPMSRSGYIRMVAARHQDRIAFAHYSYELRLLCVGVNKLDSEARRRHLNIDIHL